jgi:hypothetical protein
VEKQRLVGVNIVANKFAIICCAVALVEVFAISRASAGPPDLGGVWIPDVKDQKRQETDNVPPWKPEIRSQIKHMIDEEKAGRPFLVLNY